MKRQTIVISSKMLPKKLAMRLIYNCLKSKTMFRLFQAALKIKHYQLFRRR